MIEIIPTNTCPPDLQELSRRSAGFAAYAPCVQLDVGDGTFVPARSWPYLEGQWIELEQLKALPVSEMLSYESHLMVKKPGELGNLLVKVGCKRLIAHIESFSSAEDAAAVLSSWKSAGASEVGLALLLDTPLSSLAPLQGMYSFVQLMAIASLGYQGAPFENAVVSRIAALHAEHPDIPIEVDGGVSERNIEQLVHAGATRFGIGSAISKAQEPAEAYRKLKALAENAIQ